MAAEGLLELEVSMLQGTTVPVTIPREEYAKVLKAQLAPKLVGGPAAAQLRLFLGGQELTDDQCLGEQLDSGANLAVVVGPPVPEWAEELGFTSDHPHWLREHFARYGLEGPEWLTDDAAIWKRLADEYAAKDEQMAGFKGWGHRLHLATPALDRRLGQVHAKPGEKVQLSFSGRIWNNNNDSCIHQCGLAMGPLSEGADPFLGEIYNGVPRGAREVRAVVSVDAPQEPGAYMLYRFGDLQYSFRNAKRNFCNRRTTMVSDDYPGSFVGWLVVA
ncbi:unnamed protein product [Prorocentrum cordatum]|uniref:Ubiquitin-like domain-containing protein n=1 Tax=Prorocentrum cordatum TaxID=2364126 RepID=A0ABN9XG48_9DINO|nr:unnamed protein product [Polarella glacialis]